MLVDGGRREWESGRRWFVGMVEAGEEESKGEEGGKGKRRWWLPGTEREAHLSKSPWSLWNKWMYTYIFQGRAGPIVSGGHAGIRCCPSIPPSLAPSRLLSSLWRAFDSVGQTVGWAAIGPLIRPCRPARMHTHGVLPYRSRHARCGQRERERERGAFPRCLDD